MIQKGIPDKPVDTLVVGAGILGLWAARHAIERGESVCVLEARKVGAGASGGFLGALMPHMPDSWNDKKQMQFEGLTSLGTAISELEAATGGNCGYRRCGRIMPLNHDRMAEQVLRRIAGSELHWDGCKLALQNADDHGNWINPQMAQYGVQYDDISARVNPRSYLDALASFVRPRCHLVEGTIVTSIADGGRKVFLAGGGSISAGQVIVANGWEAYQLLQPYFGSLMKEKLPGRGVKGQALLLEHNHEDELPIVYHDGVYVVPHAGGKVAVGSTSVNEWRGDPDSFDDEDTEFYQRAIELVPAIKNSRIVGKWAGVRPRNTLEGRGTSPWFGPVPGCDHLIALVGGFKITFGIAHLDWVSAPWT